MLHEVALFWAVIAAFVLADQALLLLPGQDCLRFGRDGRLRYDPSPRLLLRRRELVLTQPFDPFDRVVPCRGDPAVLSAAAWGTACRAMRRARPALDRLSMLGGGYLLLLVAGALGSVWLPFERVLATLVVVHLLVWSVALRCLVRHRHELQLDPLSIATRAFEALVVPGHLACLAKRLSCRRPLELPAFAVGLYRLRQLSGPVRDRLLVGLLRRLDEQQEWLPAGETNREAEAVLAGYRQCLTGAARVGEP